MKIAGLDLSLVGTAVCVPDIETNDLNISTLTQEGKLKGPARLIAIRDCIMKQLLDHNVTSCFVEGFSFASKGRSVFDIGGLGWIVKVALLENGFSYYDVPPTTLKLFVTSKGNSPKNVMLEKTFRKYGFGSDVLKDDNQVDAFGLAKLGEAYLRWINGDTNFKEYEVRAFAKVVGPVTL